jgi:predicted DsbA family dithiol-disulfide isomerase
VPPTVRLDVWSDIACPWCYIGKRRLATAVARTGIPVDVTWHAFELAPGLPPEGEPAEQYYADKFGSAARMRDNFEEMTARGRADDIRFAFDLMMRAPNTRLAHRLIAIARELGGATAQDLVVEALFRAHFTDGVDVCDSRALVAAIPAAAGLDPAMLASKLAGDDGLAAVLADEEVATVVGFSAVPFFLAESKLAVSGAQPVEVFESMLGKAREL